MALHRRTLPGVDAVERFGDLMAAAAPRLDLALSLIAAAGRAEVDPDGLVAALDDMSATLHPEPFVESHAFYADAVFDERRSTAELYDAAVRPLVAGAVLRGGVATVLCFGQTGSGKTHTTRGLLDELRGDLPLDVLGWRVSAVEVAGAAVSAAACGVSSHLGA